MNEFLAKKRTGKQCKRANVLSVLALYFFFFEFTFKINYLDMKDKAKFSVLGVMVLNSFGSDADLFK
jgi:hypothetical protein